MAKQNTKVNEQELDSAQDMWGIFTVLLKWSSVAAAVTLILLLLFLY